MRDEVAQSKSHTKRLKLRTLLSKFGYSKRSDANTAEITKLLSDTGMALNPPIVRLNQSLREVVLSRVVVFADGETRMEQAWMLLW